MTNGFSLTTSAELLLALPLSEALEESKDRVCHSYGIVFYSRAKQCRQEDLPDCANAWRLLGQVCQMMLRPDSPAEPFQPICRSGTGRSLVPEDIDDRTAQAPRQLADVTVDPELGARLCDVVWVRLRDHRAARRAIEQYLPAAEHLFYPVTWPNYVTRMERAARLARQLNAKRQIARIVEEIEKRITYLDGTDPLYMTSRLMQILHDFSSGDTGAMGSIALKAARSAEQEQDFRRARAHYEDLAKWRRRSGDEAGELSARVAVAASYESEAAFHQQAGNEFAAADCLQQAHDLYRNVPSM